MKWRHKKRGTIYTFIGEGNLQCGGMTPLRDMEPMIIYRASNGHLWVRPATEFFDGRFEQVNDTVLPGQNPTSEA